MELSAYGKLIRNKLVAMGVPAVDADKIILEQRIRHQWGPKKHDVEFLSLALFRDTLRFLELAEHIARVFHNWNHCYLVDTSRVGLR
jgi:hypothetical protein